MSPSTILHVDDDSNDTVLLQHACRKAGWESNLQTVSDGEEAIAYLEGKDKFADRARYPLPALVILDLKMPRVSGFEVLSNLRANPVLQATPVVVLSSSNHDVDVRRAYELGANSYIVKPVGFDSLVDIVRTLHRYWVNLNVHV